jgi:hypothetical protein
MLNHNSPYYNPRRHKVWDNSARNAHLPGNSHDRGRNNMFYQKKTTIAELISTLASPYPPVSLIKHHKGTAINQPGSIIDINPVSLTIQATQRQTFYVLSGKIHLRSGAFPGAICATIHAVDYTHGTFQLSDLSYDEWQDRKSERVQPKSPTYIKMNYYRRSYRAFLQDISNEGMGILVNESVDPDGWLQPGKKLLIEFELGPKYLFTGLKVEIIYRKDVGYPLVKHGLLLLPNRIQKNNLQAYITKRSDEILYEMEQEYIRMREPFRVENQRF